MSPPYIKKPIVCENVIICVTPASQHIHYIDTNLDGDCQFSYRDISSQSGWVFSEVVFGLDSIFSIRIIREDNRINLSGTDQNKRMDMQDKS